MKGRRFEAMELHRDGSLEMARWSLVPEGEGWNVLREDEPILALGPGHVPLDVISCGVCATDLARPLLPFPLPQVVGHEVLARDECGRRFVIEINASHLARGLDGSTCPACSTELPTHCPERTVLGIDRLPGGFGAAVLAPHRALVAVPDDVPDDTAVLTEPFAAALHAARSVGVRDGDTVAVLGPRRLGMLVIAALDCRRRRGEIDISIEAWVRRAGLCDLALAIGADAVRDLSRESLPLADIVIDCTGNPDGLVTGLEQARREVHLKSTHGRRAAGLDHLTELVVDELGIARFDDRVDIEAVAGKGGRPRLAWLRPTAPPRWVGDRFEVVRVGNVGATLDQLQSEARPGEWPRCDAAVVEDEAGLAASIRPLAGDPRSLLRPRGRIYLGSTHTFSSAAAKAIVERGLIVTSSRCGDFREAMAMLADDARLRELGRRMVTHRFPRTRLAAAFDAAASRDAVKVVVES